MCFICIEPECPKFNQRESVLGRKPIFNHIQKKSDERIIKVLKRYDIINDFSVLTRLTLVNVLVDCCYAGTATRLLNESSNQKGKRDE